MTDSCEFCGKPVPVGGRFCSDLCAALFRAQEAEARAARYRGILQGIADRCGRRTCKGCEAGDFCVERDVKRALGRKA